MPTQFCRHIRINGERCGSPALRSETFCYYHVEQGRRHRRPNPRSSATPTVLHPMTLQDGTQREPMLAAPTEPLQLDFPPLEDRHSIQLALSLVINALAQNRIDPKSAALILYGLQVASSNARNLDAATVPDKPAPKVRSTVLDEASGTRIAPDEDPEKPEESPTYKFQNSAYRFLEELKAELANQQQNQTVQPPNATSSSDVPQAAAQLFTPSSV
jgi:hypothetical protein